MSDVITNKRQELSKKEGRLLTEIEGSTTELNQSINKALQVTMLVGGGLLIGYTAYKVMSGDSGKSSKKKEKKQGMTQVKAQSSAMNPIVAFAIERGIAFLIDRLKNKLVK
ncbi:MAG: hypothetical protein JXQ96_03375 [Cyclobacteriaceae bacterium]